MLHRLIWAAAAFVAGREMFGFLSGEVKRKQAPEPRPDPGPAQQDQSAVELDEAAVVESPEDLQRELRDANRSLVLLGGTLVLAGAGFGIHPLFRLLSVPCLVAGFYPSARGAWLDWKNERRLSYPALEVMQATAELVIGRIALTALGGVFFAGGRRTLLKHRRDARAEMMSAFGDTPEFAWVTRGEVEVQVSLEHLELGDVVVVRPGDQIPVDGRIVYGAIGVDQRSLTGESRLEELTVGDSVLAATLVLSGEAQIVTERTGSDTLAARVDRLLANTASYEHALSHRVALVSERSIPATLAMAGFGLVTRGPVGVLGGFWTNAIDMAWANSPLSMHNTIRAALNSGIVIKDGRSLEQLSSIDTVVFDKTGTLTLDQLAVVDVHAGAGFEPAQLLRMTAALEINQQHPIAQAILEAVANDPRPPLEASDLRIDVGYGLTGTIDGQSVMLGSARLMARCGIELPDTLLALASRAERQGRSLLYVAVDRRFAGVIELEAPLRPEAAALIERLRAGGYSCLMVTGDEEGPARSVAEQLGISDYVARALPEDKGNLIVALQGEGRRVCFIGDGINDTLAMRRANVSVSLGGASPLAVESAQIVIQRGSLLQLDALLQIGKTYHSDQDFIFNAALTTTAISMTAFLLTPTGLSGQVLIYLTGFGLSLGVATLPRIRNYLHRGTGWGTGLNHEPSEDARERTRGLLALPAASESA